MLEMGEVLRQQLKWQQVNASTNSFVLTAGENQVARLDFPQMFGSLANAEIGGDAFTIKKSNFWGNSLVVQRPNAEGNLAIFEANDWTGNGKLTVGPKTFEWKTKGLGTKALWLTSDGNTLMTFEVGGVFKLKSDVLIGINSADLEEAPLLLVIGWYLLVQSYQAAAAVV